MMEAFTYGKHSKRGSILITVTSDGRKLIRKIARISALIIGIASTILFIYMVGKSLYDTGSLLAGILTGIISISILGRCKDVRK